MCETVACRLGIKFLVSVFFPLHATLVDIAKEPTQFFPAKDISQQKLFQGVCPTSPIYCEVFLALLNFCLWIFNQYTSNSKESLPFPVSHGKSVWQIQGGKQTYAELSWKDFLFRQTWEISQSCCDPNGVFTEQWGHKGRTTHQFRCNDNITKYSEKKGGCAQVSKAVAGLHETLQPKKRPEKKTHMFFEQTTVKSYI